MARSRHHLPILRTSRWTFPVPVRIGRSYLAHGYRCRDRPGLRLIEFRRNFAGPFLIETGHCSYERAGWT